MQEIPFEPTVIQLPRQPKAVFNPFDALSWMLPQVEQVLADARIRTANRSDKTVGFRNRQTPIISCLEIRPFRIEDLKRVRYQLGVFIKNLAKVVEQQEVVISM